MDIYESAARGRRTRSLLLLTVIWARRLTTPWPA